MSKNRGTQNSGLLGTGRNIGNVAVMLTHKCQMACRYCFVDQDYPDMTVETLEKAIDLLFTSPFPKVRLQFFGGEPLLRSDLIQQGISYAERKSRKVNKGVCYFITTNGLLIDQRLLTFLSRFKTTVMLSMDGTDKTQLKNRPLRAAPGRDYYPLLLRAVGLLEKNRRVPYFINMVFSPADIAFLNANITALLGLGCKNVCFGYAIGAHFTKKHMFQYLEVLAHLLTKHKNKDLLRASLDKESEPLLASPQITVSAGGDIYIGCAFVLEKAFPRIHRLFYRGNLSTIANIACLRRSPEDQLRLLEDHKGVLHPYLLSNLRLGFVLRSFYDYLDGDKKAMFRIPDKQEHWFLAERQ